tara:strand:- start:2102 stop:2620 length:519 start_codon:yes stop_codon:yes gene_type:complete
MTAVAETELPALEGKVDPHGNGGALARALLILGSVLLPLGLTLPILETQRFIFWREAYSLIDVARALVQGDDVLLAFVVIVFSIIFPVLKLFGLVRLHLAAPARINRTEARLIEMLGKWTMMDVLIAALVVFTLGRSGVASAVELPGLYFFAGAAACMMLASGRIARSHTSN